MHPTDTMNRKVIAVVIVAILVIACAAAAIVVMNNDKDDDHERVVLNDTLDVYGNANNDGTIDADDVSFLKKIIEANGNDDASDDIDWTQKYPFADANHDGTIDQKDIDQTQALIDSKATYVNMIDGDGGFKHVRCNPQRLAVDQIQLCEYVCIMGQADKVVCADFPGSILGNAFYFDHKVATYGSNSSPDYELLESSNVDLYLTFFAEAVYQEKATKLPNTDVVYLGLYYTDTLNLEQSSFVKAFLKGGYIFNDVDRAKAYLNWIEDTRDKIKAISDTIPDSDKKNVLISDYRNSYFSSSETSNNVTAYADGDVLGQAAILAGAKLASQSFKGYGTGATSYKTDTEWLGMQDIDFLFMHSVRLQGNGKVVESVPDQGYTVDNWAQFKEVQNNVSELRYVKMAGIQPDNVYLIAGDFRNNASSGMLLAAFMVKILYPDASGDFDPYEIFQEYMDWMGKSDYDIRSHGTFIVPPFASYY